MNLQKANGIYRLNVMSVNDKYRYDIIRFNQWLDGRPISFTAFREYVQSCNAEIKAGELTGSSVTRYLVSLKTSFIHTLEEQRPLQSKEVDKINELFRELRRSVPKEKKVISSETWLKDEDIQRIKKKVDRKTWALVAAYFETASRASELSQAKLTDCREIDGGYLVNVLGKGRKRRDVFLQKKTYKELTRHWSNDIYLIANNRGGPLSRVSIWKIIHKAGEAIGRQVWPHLLRHSWGSVAAVKIGIPATADYMGHTNTKTTLLYLHGQATPAAVFGVNQSVIKYI